MAERYYLNQQTVNELRELKTKVRKLEQLLGPVSENRQFSTTYVLKVGTNGISARAGTTAGSGVATLVLRAGSSKVMTERSPSITVQNLLATEFPEGSYILATKDAYGDFWVGSSSAPDQIAYPGIAQSNIEAGGYGKVELSTGDLVAAKNHTQCPIISGNLVTVFYTEKNGFWFTTCKCCDDDACCSTPIWVCLCDTHVQKFYPDGSTIIIDTTDCCSADCSVSSRVEITLSCTGSTITGSYTQYCDDGGGETSDSGTFNSASLSALCDTTTETGYLNAIASAIGFCNPDISFYNYEPPCSGALSCGGQDLSGDNISTVTVTIAGIDATSDPAAGCDCSDFNGTHNMTLVSSDGTQGSVWSKSISSSCSPYFDNAEILVYFGCPTVPGCSGWADVAVDDTTGYVMQVYITHGTEGVCFYETHSKCFNFASTDDPTAIDTGTVAWPGRTATMFPPCITCFYDGDIFGNPIGSFTNVTVRVQTT